VGIYTQKASNALGFLDKAMTDKRKVPAIPFKSFIEKVADSPEILLRNVFQVFHGMIANYMGSGVDEYPDDPESIHYVYYDCSKLFEENSDRPFFADRLFANRLVNLVETMKRGTQQNKVYVFNGPPGCGKSTFLNNLLRKFEEYANSPEGMRYELVWHIDPSLFDIKEFSSSDSALEQLATLLSINHDHASSNCGVETHLAIAADGAIEIPCPSHDYPLLLIPKQYRETFLSELFDGNQFREKLFHDREYHWVFRDKPCTFCSSLYRALLGTIKNTEDVHAMIYARPYRFNRRVGEGIAVYNPGDQPPADSTIVNPVIQSKINKLLQNSTDVFYLYSRYAKTNNGIYALMDVKSHNSDRFIELHNIISEGVHKVEDIEENVNSLLFAIMNPEDQRSVKEFKSFSDRTEYINIPYVMDITTEVKIYKHTFGHTVEELFLPRVLLNFARVIVSSRLSTRSEALLDWIEEPKKYNLFCDENLQLLKMEIYAGVIPSWLVEDDRKRLNANRRRRILAESDREGIGGISGRDSIKVFNEFILAYGKHDKLINMSMLCDFFTRKKKDLLQSIPSGFLDSLMRMYNYTVLQEVKESLYYYNERQIARDIMNYLFAVNFEAPAQEICTYTKEKLKITEEFFSSIETRLLGGSSSTGRRKEFRESVQWEYTSRTLTQEILLEQKKITETEIYKRLHDRYVQNVKEKVLDPFLDNENFRRGIKEYDTPDFKTYDKRIRVDIRYLLRNLQRKFNYTEKGAREVCMYVIDNDLARSFSGK
jgi:predicted Ser/Thr protein kinase